MCVRVFLFQALYENLMVDLPFSPFFLRKLTVGGDGAVDMHHLSSLDRDLYHQLLLLKHYDGNFEDLSLDFTVITSAFDCVKVSVCGSCPAENSVTVLPCHI